MPGQPASKSATVAPKLNSEMELGALPGLETAQNDIMQVARKGDIAAMEKLLDSGDFDATYSDEEGITPLHVGNLHCGGALGLTMLFLLVVGVDQ